MASTEELVAVARRGNSAAFAELVRLYERGAILTSYAVLRDYHAAQDVVQEAFLSAYTNLSQLRDSTAFGPWLLKIVRRQALRANRVPRHEPVPVDIPDRPLETKPDWLKPYAEVVQQIAQLSERDRTLVVLRYVDGRSVEEITQLTGQPSETVRKQIYRAVQRLRTQLIEVPT